MLLFRARRQGLLKLFTLPNLYLHKSEENCHRLSDFPWLTWLMRGKEERQELWLSYATAVRSLLLEDVYHVDTMISLFVGGVTCQAFCKRGLFLLHYSHLKYYAFLESKPSYHFERKQ